MPVKNFEIPKENTTDLVLGSGHGRVLQDAGPWCEWHPAWEEAYSSSSVFCMDATGTGPMPSLL